MDNSRHTTNWLLAIIVFILLGPMLAAQFGDLLQSFAGLVQTLLGL